MGNTFGNHLKLSIFGESHGTALGIVIDGLPSGFSIDMDKVVKEMARRAPGRSPLSTQRKEPDLPEIVSGYFEDRTTGTPLCAVIRNSDNRSKDYGLMKVLMRPGHGDYPGYVRYDGFQDYRGGGHFSGRITAPLVFCGAVVKQILEQSGIAIGSHILQIGTVKSRRFENSDLREKCFMELSERELPVLGKSEAASAGNDPYGSPIEEQMRREILAAKEEGDSVGGIIECAAIGIPAGVGDPFFDSVESVLSHLLFSVPAVKGVEFGDGFAMAERRGSVCNDAYRYRNGNVETTTNHNGGITGGITNGMPILFKTAIKPTPSISIEQDTINLENGENARLSVPGRHDPCIVQRAVPVIEAVCAIGLYECLKRRKTDGIGL